MISEVDIRDWDRIDFTLPEDAVQLCLDNGYFHRMYDLQEFIDQVKRIRDKQIKSATKQIPALFRPLVEAVNRGE